MPTSGFGNAGAEFGIAQSAECGEYSTQQPYHQTQADTARFDDDACYIRLFLK
jgi:hypothetical protein